MVIQPRIRGFVCLTAHPAGCKKNVQEQIDYVISNGKIEKGPKSALVIGASTGYGLASRISASFGSEADTLGVFLEKEPVENKTATAGWYNTAGFTSIAKTMGLKVYNINGDAYSNELKKQVVEIASQNFKPFDLIVYSLAAPRRQHPKTGEVAKSVLKPIGKAYDGKTLDTDREEIKPVHLEPASEQEIAETISVMGGEDWEMWINTLAEKNLLAEGCKTVAYTYIGSKLTWPIYWEGTIGKAKEDLDKTSKRLDDLLKPVNGKSYVAVMKALVTQASSAIPVVPLYISILYKVMKEIGNHEGCIEQIYRMFKERLYVEKPPTDEIGRLRLDDWELTKDVQERVNELWPRVNSENIREMTDFEGYKNEFLRLFGFGLQDVNYDADTNPVVLLD